jgi:hypothetical protein
MAVTVTVPPTTKLIALADLKALLGIADSAHDTLLGNIIQRGSDAIARFCNCVFAQRTVIETLPGPGGQLLKLKFSPIVTLTSIAFDGATVDPDTYTLTEPEAGIVFCESYWAYTGHKYSYAAPIRTATTCRTWLGPIPFLKTFSRPRWSCARACGSLGRGIPA